MTDALTKIEGALHKVYAKAPSLPATWRAWITGNVWWIVKVLALLDLVGVVFIIFVIVAVGLADNRLAVSDTSSIQTLYSPESIVVVAVAAVQVGLLFAAIGPLRRRQYKGWRLVFIGELLSVASAVVLIVVHLPSFDTYHVLRSLVIIVLELYVLFQIRDGFMRKGVTPSRGSASE